MEQPPQGDVIEMDEMDEMDELCIRFSPALWLWVAVSRATKLVLGFVVADRSDAALLQLLEDELHPGHASVTGLA